MKVELLRQKRGQGWPKRVRAQESLLFASFYPHSLVSEAASKTLSGTLGNSLKTHGLVSDS